MYQLYALFHEKPLDASKVEVYLSFLPPQRRERALRYRSAVDRDNCILSYLLLRYALKSCFGLHDPRIEFPQRGKPYLPEHPSIHFNISHCSAGCVVAVADVPIGVDIQDIRTVSPRLVAYCCCAGERECIEHAAQSDAEFARIWAMKESWLKLSGRGISSALPSVDTTQLADHIEVVRQRNCYIAVACEQEINCK